ncbi:unnamed protein product [Miscanthus lutarioriparius]|uniref:KIB1-4 beta-propeller domain-containing protein n=1 Tax=Miscanthus lutarioriparius TaxID=422564 RepID=A0A811MZT7_9POAL|nr:unnamed protein product [Miscanthus lutarioriparius]
MEATALILLSVASTWQPVTTVVSPSLVPPEAIKILTSLVSDQFTDDYFSNTQEEEEQEAENRCFLVESAGEILVVFKLPHRIEVFKIGDDMAVQPVQSIGRRALFVGNSRCLSVDSDKFAAVDANSIYYIEYMSYDVRVYSLSNVVQLLGCYAYVVRSSQLGLEQMLARSFSMLNEFTFDGLGEIADSLRDIDD